MSLLNLVLRTDSKVLKMLCVPAVGHRIPSRNIWASFATNRALTNCRVSRLALFVAESRTNVVNAARRYFAKKSSVLPFEVEAANVAANKDVVVFRYSNDRFFKLLTFFGAAQFIFWVNIAAFFYSVPMEQLVAKEREKMQFSQGSWWTTFSRWQTYYHNRIAVGCLSLGLLVLVFTLMYPLRTVARLTLLKGGNHLKVMTYWHFGRKSEFSVPLDSVSCSKSRQAPGTQLAMKIRGRWFYYMIDNREGQFIEPKLFDSVVGLSRSLK